MQNQIIWSRLVARVFRVKGESDRSDLFAAMPHLEAKRVLFRMAVRRCREKPCGKYKIMSIDVKRARLNGEVPEDEKVFVLLPSEAGGGVARLKRWLYGMRPRPRRRRSSMRPDSRRKEQALPEGHLGRHRLFGNRGGT